MKSTNTPEFLCHHWGRFSEGFLNLRCQTFPIGVTSIEKCVKHLNSTKITNLSYLLRFDNLKREKTLHWKNAPKYIWSHIIILITKLILTREIVMFRIAHLSPRRCRTSASAVYLWSSCKSQSLALSRRTKVQKPLIDTMTGRYLAGTITLTKISRNEVSQKSELFIRKEKDLIIIIDISK